VTKHDKRKNNINSYFLEKSMSLIFSYGLWPKDR